MMRNSGTAEKDRVVRQQEERKVVCVVGVDGCHNAWFAVSLDLQTNQISGEVYPTPAGLCRSLATAAVIAVDVPIGLTDSGSRECDREARNVLGRPRASSVFPAPIRAALRATTREEASRTQKRIDGRGIGVQSWGILPKIREWDRFLRANPQFAKRVFEVHPEVSFWALNNSRSMQHRKKAREGRDARRKLLVQQFGARALEDTRARHARSQVADDDLHDAFAALWTARRLHASAAVCLPHSPPDDAMGLPMAIWY